VEIGVTVSPFGYGMVAFRFEMVSLTDQMFRFNVNLTKNRLTIFQKMYAITMAPQEDLSPASLEARA
jgi:hypothetical protein